MENTNGSNEATSIQHNTIQTENKLDDHVTLTGAIHDQPKTCMDQEPTYHSNVPPSYSEVFQLPQRSPPPVIFQQPTSYTDENINNPYPPPRYTPSQNDTQVYTEQPQGYGVDQVVVHTKQPEENYIYNTQGEKEEKNNDCSCCYYHNFICIYWNDSTNNKHCCSCHSCNCCESDNCCAQGGCGDCDDCGDCDCECGDDC